MALAVNEDIQHMLREQRMTHPNPSTLHGMQHRIAVALDETLSRTNGPSVSELTRVVADVISPVLAEIDELRRQVEDARTLMHQMADAARAGDADRLNALAASIHRDSNA